jgi:hypothetical protein
MPMLFDDVEIDRHLRSQSAAPRKTKAKAKAKPKRETARITTWHRDGYAFAVGQHADDEIFIGRVALAKSGVTVPLKRNDVIEFVRVESRNRPGQFEATQIKHVA